MELLLWRWSTAVQITSALMIAAFFLALTRSVRRVELQPWTGAWLANLVALGATVAFWFLQPSSHLAFAILRFCYLFGKTAFLVLLVTGAWAFTGTVTARRGRLRLLIATALFSLLGAYALQSVEAIGVAQSGLMAVLFAAGAWVLVVRKPAGSAGLACGFMVRSALAAAETLAYANPRFPNRAIVLASHSSFDTGAEWIIALGCVLALHRTIQLELTRANDELLAAQKVLQELVDLDPLTGLANRRALPGILRDAFSTGATILFFDIDDFKHINDSYGHHAGDECLRRFARTVEASFRPEDHVVRYAGDEFVVVVKGNDPEQALARVDRIRERLRFERVAGPDIHFAAGHCQLPVGGEPEEALRAADAAMYQAKQGRLKTRA